MPTIMIIPAGVYQVPAILKAKELGYRVITADYLPENPGHKYADRSEFVSILDIDKILALAKDEHIDAIFTMASDIAVKTVGYVSKRLGLMESLPYEAIDTICLKHRFREFQQQIGFAYPHFQAVTDFSTFKLALSEIGFPAMVKPSDASGSKGVFYLGYNSFQSEKELMKIFTISQSFSRNKILCVEKYMEGLDISGDALIVDGEIILCEVTNKYITPAPDFVPIGHSVPSGLNNTVQSEVKTTLQEVVRSLQITNGSLNFDIIITQDSIIILEMSPRLGGNCIPSIIRYGTDFDLVEAALLISMGENPIVKKHKKKPTGVRILRSDKDGILTYHSNLERMQEKYSSILELEIDVPIGSAVRKYTQGANRLGHVICRAGSINKLEQELDLIEQELNITVESFEDAVVKPNK